MQIKKINSTIIYSHRYTIKKTKKDFSKYLNRDISLLEFNKRVFVVAQFKELPLLEKINMLSIASTNIDEFFCVRVSSLNSIVSANPSAHDQTGKKLINQIDKIYSIAKSFEKNRYCFLNNKILPSLSLNSINIIKYSDLKNEDTKILREFFRSQIYPLLSPIIISQTHTSPTIRSKELTIAVCFSQKTSPDLPIAAKRAKTSFALVGIPKNLERFVLLNSKQNRSKNFVLIEDVISNNLDLLFTNSTIIDFCDFRVLRDCGFDFDEQADDLAYEMKQQLFKQQSGKICYVQTKIEISSLILKKLHKILNFSSNQLFLSENFLDLSCLSELYNFNFNNTSLKYDEFLPIIPKKLKSPNIFAQIKKEDILLIHPYQSFNCVIDFLFQAANDPKVVSIKQTLYRIASNSKIIDALMLAAQNGKQVLVLLEIKARFDEHNNLNWAKKLETAGVCVIYGVPKLKTHAKIALIVRKEKFGIKRYMHIATGNYNEQTAPLYTDFGLLTCNEKFGNDATEFFNALTLNKKNQRYKKFITSPTLLQPFLIEKINACAAQTNQQRHIILKLNSLDDRCVIDALYAASLCGVKIDLIVRGICTLRPNCSWSKNINVYSVIGRFLEHSRAYFFSNDSTQELYISSADLMPRNLYRRIELCVPIENQKIKQNIVNILNKYLTGKKFKMLGNGNYIFEEGIDSQSL